MLSRARSRRSRNSASSCCTLSSSRALSLTSSLIFIWAESSELDLSLYYSRIAAFLEHSLRFFSSWPSCIRSRSVFSISSILCSSCRPYSISSSFLLTCSLVSVIYLSSTCTSFFTFSILDSQKAAAYEPFPFFYSSACCSSSFRSRSRSFSFAIQSWSFCFNSLSSSSRCCRFYSPSWAFCLASSPPLAFRRSSFRCSR